MINKNKKDLSIALADYLINTNVCKNERCDNFAVSEAKEYISPSHYLGFPALHCGKCGSNALLLNNNDINQMFLPKIDFYLTKIIQTCPHCYSLKSICYGKTQQHSLRRQCKVCQTVYHDEHFLTKQQSQQQKKLILLCQLLFEKKSTDFKSIMHKLKVSHSYFYLLLQQLEYNAIKNGLSLSSKILSQKNLNISTYSKVLTSRNQICLWGITSVLSDSGYILLNSFNYTEQAISPESCYDSQKLPISYNNEMLSDIEKILLKYKQFFERKSFDLLIYHNTPFKADKYKLVEPVICAYVHFHTLKQYYQSLKTCHYLEHEIVLRSAVMTIYNQAIKNKHCAIYYLHELPQSDTHISSIVKHKMGWWDNDWYELKNAQQQSCRFLGLLTPKNNISNTELASLPATFEMNEQFYESFFNYFPQSTVRKLSPKYLIKLLNIFMVVYNFCLCDSKQYTPAQKAGICSKPFTVEELIKYNTSM